MSIFTFGYGGEHDADLLRGVAEAGNGLFYYIDNADSIPESFCDCLGGLLSVAAQVCAPRVYNTHACACLHQVGMICLALLCICIIN